MSPFGLVEKKWWDHVFKPNVKFTLKFSAVRHTLMSRYTSIIAVSVRDRFFDEYQVDLFIYIHNLLATKLFGLFNT